MWLKNGYPLPDAFICANGKVYNYNLEMVFDYEAQDLELVRMLGHRILFKLENGTFLWKDLDTGAVYQEYTP